MEETLGEMLKLIRLKKNVSTKDVIEKMKCPISQQHFHLIEADRNIPTMETLLDLCDGLDIDEQKEKLFAKWRDMKLSRLIKKVERDYRCLLKFSK